MYIIKESTLQEAITKEYIEKIHNDMLVFSKNIKRITNGEQYYNFVKEWNKWINGYFHEKFGKNVVGIGTILKNKDLEKVYNEFSEWVNSALLPTKLDIKRYLDRNNPWHPMIETDYKLAMRFPYIDNHIHWDDAYQLFSEISASKYIGIKKKIDEFFKYIYYVIDSVTISQKYITDTIKIENSLISIEYHDSIEEDKDFIFKAIDDTRKAFKLMKDAKFSKAYTKTNLRLSTVDPKSKESNVKNGKNYGLGGFYLKSEGITILEGRIYSYDPFNMIDIIIHESGHKYYYEDMNTKQRNEWKDFYYFVKNRDSSSYLKLINDFFQKEIKILEDILEEKVPIDKRFTDSMEYSKWLMNNEDIRILEDLLQNSIPKQNIGPFIYDRFSDVMLWPKFKRDGYMNTEIGIFKYSYFRDVINSIYAEVKLLIDDIKILDVFPSEYGSTNESEFFAETFTAYCLWKTSYGRNRFKLFEPVFEKFIDITGVRSAWHERKTHENN